ncbi:hypothetical protein JL721_10716 [Aureococcus anophagefferens]|nr:hypothetical protein JL721_10716 [Aureococcus anophagefferens]
MRSSWSRRGPRSATSATAARALDGFGASLLGARSVEADRPTMDAAARDAHDAALRAFVFALAPFGGRFEAHVILDYLARTADLLEACPADALRLLAPHCAASPSAARVFCRCAREPAAAAQVGLRGPRGEGSERGVAGGPSRCRALFGNACAADAAFAEDVAGHAVACAGAAADAVEALTNGAAADLPRTFAPIFAFAAVFERAPRGRDGKLARRLLPKASALLDTRGPCAPDARACAEAVLLALRQGALPQLADLAASDDGDAAFRVLETAFSARARRPALALRSVSEATPRAAVVAAARACGSAVLAGVLADDARLGALLEGDRSPAQRRCAIVHGCADVAAAIRDLAAAPGDDAASALAALAAGPGAWDHLRLVFGHTSLVEALETAPCEPLDDALRTLATAAPPPDLAAAFYGGLLARGPAAPRRRRELARPSRAGARDGAPPLESRARRAPPLVLALAAGDGAHRRGAGGPGPRRRGASGARGAVPAAAASFLAASFLAAKLGGGDGGDDDGAAARVCLAALGAAGAEAPAGDDYEAGLFAALLALLRRDGAALAEDRASALAAVAAVAPKSAWPRAWAAALRRPGVAGLEGDCAALLEASEAPARDGRLAAAFFAARRSSRRGGLGDAAGRARGRAGFARGRRRALHRRRDVAGDVAFLVAASADDGGAREGAARTLALVELSGGLGLVPGDPARDDDDAARPRAFSTASRPDDDDAWPAGEAPCGARHFAHAGRALGRALKRALGLLDAPGLLSFVEKVLSRPCPTRERDATTRALDERLDRERPLFRAREPGGPPAATPFARVLLEETLPSLARAVSGDVEHPLEDTADARHASLVAAKMADVLARALAESCRGDDGARFEGAADAAAELSLALLSKLGDAELVDWLRAAAAWAAAAPDAAAPGALRPAPATDDEAAARRSAFYYQVATLATRFREIAAPRCLDACYDQCVRDMACPAEARAGKKKRKRADARARGRRSLYAREDAADFANRRGASVRRRPECAPDARALVLVESHTGIRLV